MLARRSRLKLRNTGASIELPLLVPSFTSKGFPIFTDPETKLKRSESDQVFETMAPLIDNCMLISAYDMHHKYLVECDTRCKGKELVFIDSGGYELSSDYDSTEPKQPSSKSEQGYSGETNDKDRGFGIDQYRRVLRGLKQNLPFIVCNFDWDSRGYSIKDQILMAQRLFNEFPHLTTNFLIKPTGTIKGEVRKELPIQDVIAHVPMLKAFDVVGVTEKELGKNLMIRLRNLAKLRAAMDRESIDAPIHVWGGLDPVLTPLYFFAGAEIFDGVSWLRYAYHDGMAVYRDSSIVLDKSLGVRVSYKTSRYQVMLQNVTFLEQLASKLREFVDDGGSKFKSKFGRQAGAFERAYRTMCTELPELQRGA